MTYDRYGDDDVLQLTDQPLPKVGPGEVLVRVRAAAVNPVDWKVMSGGLDQMMEVVFPAIPGWDFAGVVERVGIDTPEFVVGDEVYGYARKDFVHGGTFAEYVSVPVRCLARKPAALDFEHAGALPLTGLTAWQALTRVGTGEGDVVLVHNGSGGVGQMAIQIAKALGATVIATASANNHDHLRELGADHAVAYGDGLADRVREVAPDGVSVVLDLVGGVVDDSLPVMRADARLVSIADPAVLGHGGQWMWVRPSASDLDSLTALVDAGRLRVDVEQSFALDDLPQAFALSRGHHVRGKLVITL